MGWPPFLEMSNGAVTMKAWYLVPKSMLSPPPVLPMTKCTASISGASH